MELAVFLLLIVGFIFCFKLFAFFFKAGFFILTIPLQIAAVIIGMIGLIVILPFAIVGSIFAIILAPFIAIGPLLPFLLIGAGIYFIARH